MLKTIFLWALEWAVSKISSLVMKLYQRKKADDKIEQEETAIKEQVKTAESEKEREDAARGSLDNV